MDAAFAIRLPGQPGADGQRDQRQNQMADQLEAGRVLACGRSVMLVPGFRVIPDQTWVECDGCEHGQDDHAGESDGAESRFDAGETAKLTIATRMAMTKMSSMDQRPIHSMNRKQVFAGAATLGDAAVLRTATSQSQPA